MPRIIPRQESKRDSRINRVDTRQNIGDIHRRQHVQHLAKFRVLLVVEQLNNLRLDECGRWVHARDNRRLAKSVTRQSDKIAESL